MNEIPVIFVHNGDHHYLKLAINSSLRYGNVSYLIGDESNKDFCANWCDIDSLSSKRFEKFKEVYIHMSTNTYDFELMCFRRYFAVYEYINSNDIDHFVMLDSDLLTYVNYGSIPFYSKYDVSASWQKDQSNYRWSACPCVFLCTRDALNDFLEYIYMAYTNNSILSLLMEKHAYHVNNRIPGGICDMTLLYLWIKDIQENKKYSVFNNSVVNNNCVFDHNIQSSDGYLRNQFQFDRMLRMKYVYFINGFPYFVSNEGAKTRAYTLHFLGGAKTVLNSFYFEQPYITRFINRYKLRIFSSPKLSNYFFIKYFKNKGLK